MQKENEDSSSKTKLVEKVLQSPGMPIPDSARSFMEGRFSYAFNNVKIHTDNLADQSAHAINALAYTSGNNIVFKKDQYSPGTDRGKRLLAHELTHVIQQQSGGISRRVQRQVEPSTLDGFTTLPESIYVLAKEDIVFYESPLTQEYTKSRIIIKDERLELTWQKGEWYFAYDESGQKGYVKSSQLVFPPKVTRPATEEFMTMIGGILFVQAKDMHRAFQMVRTTNLVPNTGAIFWYSNGKVNPYPVDFYITIRDPNQAEIDRMNKVAGFSAITLTGGSTSTPSTTTPATPLTPEQKRWQDAEKELEPYAIQVIEQSSVTQPNKIVLSVPYESIRAINFKFEEFRLKKGFAFSTDPDSDFTYYYTVFQLLVKAKIKAVMTNVYYKPADAKQDVGGLEWLANSQTLAISENETFLKTELDKIIAEERDKRKADIEKFYAPYVDAFKKEQADFLSKAKTSIEKEEGWYNREVDKKAADAVLEKRWEARMKEGGEAFAKSSLAKEIQAAVEARFKLVQDKILHPNPYEDPIVKGDKDLFDKVKKYDDQIKSQIKYVDLKSTFESARTDLSGYLLSKHPAVQTKVLHSILMYYSEKLLYAPKDELTPYAIKKWAERNSADLQKTIEKFAPTFRKRMEEDNQTLRLSFPEYSVTTQAYTDLSYELIYAKKFFDKIISHPEADEGFWSGFTSKSLGEMLPFIHSIIGISELYEQMRVMNKKLMGGTMTVSEELLLKAVGGLQYINQIRKKPFWYRVGEGVAEAIPFMAEFIITAPIGGEGAVIGEKMAEATLRKFAVKYLEKKAVKIIIKGVGALTGALLQTLANPIEITKNIMANKMAVVSMELQPDGSFEVKVQPNPNTDAKAVWNGFVTSYVNIFTERLGGKVLPYVAGKASRLLPMAVRESVIMASLKQTAKTLEKYAGFHGILGEYEEELYGNILEALLKGEQIKWSWEDQAQTFMVVAIMGGAMRGLQTTFAAYEVLRTFRMNNKNIVLPAHVYMMLTKLTSLDNLETFKQNLKSLKLSADQVTLAMYLAEKTLNVQHEIEIDLEEEARKVVADSVPKTLKSLLDLIVKLYQAKKNFLLTSEAERANHFESLLIEGGDTPTPLLLHNLGHVNTWIAETERAIALIEGMSVLDLREGKAAEGAVEPNLEFWRNWIAGTRPYLNSALALSPGSKFTLMDDGRININGNVIISTKVLFAMLQMDKINLNRLLKASLDTRLTTDAGTTAPTIADAELDKFKALHPNSRVSVDESGLININQGMSLSKAVLEQLYLKPGAATTAPTKGAAKPPAREKPAVNKFLFDFTYNTGATPANYLKLSPEDISAIATLHPTSILSIGQDGNVKVNDQVQVSPTFLKALLLLNPSDLVRLLKATFDLNQQAGDPTKVSDESWATLKDFSSSGGYRLRFKFQFEAELNKFLADTGLVNDGRFKTLWDKASHAEKIRLWDLFNEIGGYTGKGVRAADTSPVLRMQASDFALQLDPDNLFSFVDFYQYYIAKFKAQLAVAEAGFETALTKAEADRLSDEQKKDPKKTKLTDKEKKEIFEAVSKANLGKTVEGKKQAGKAIFDQLIGNLGDPSAVGKVSTDTFISVSTDYLLGVTEVSGKLGQKKITPGLNDLQAAKAIQTIPDLAFNSLSAAVYHVEKHHSELPPSMQNAADPGTAYFNAARTAVKSAQQISVNVSPNEAGVRSISFFFHMTESGEKYILRTIVRLDSDGNVSIDTLIIVK
ncbi:MAG TPA: DUF4157 domain-containing protein [Cyclobacteriaceae bacterium]|nr:DUF4157 domain-containing protein [Cyclobacteriaceae bacterium]